MSAEQAAARPPDERSAEAAPAAGGRGEAYHGQVTRRLVSDSLWIDVLETAGPRIVRLGQAGSTRNLLAETPGVGWETPHGRYELFGGHRLWFAPEDPDRVAVPDGQGLVITAEPGGIRMTGEPEPQTGLVRSIGIHPLAGGPSLDVCHELHNVAAHPIELAPWSITQLPLGGTVILPQRAATPGHHVRPNRSLVLWPYTSWEDPRFRPLDGLFVLRAEAGPSLKLGYFNEAGWVGYLRDDVLLVRRFEALPGRPHPDLGCNVEIYIGNRFLELELLGPLTELAPGATAQLTERWEVLSVEGGSGEDRIKALAERMTRRSDPAA
jgi:hypothetical protein